LSAARVMAVTDAEIHHQTTDLMVEGVVRDGEWTVKMSW